MSDYDFYANDYEAMEDERSLKRECDEEQAREDFYEMFGKYPEDLDEDEDPADYDMSDPNEGLYGEL